MTIYLTSDQHWMHKNILEFEPARKKWGPDHTEALIARHNKVVKSDDMVYMLGDLALGARREELATIISKLNGRKILIRGNHDAFTDGAYYSMGFVAVLHEAVIRVGKTYIRLSHYPYREVWYRRLFKKVRHLEKRPVNDGMLLCHGHCHGKFKHMYKNQVHIGVDQWDGYPISINKLLEIINEASNSSSSGGIINWLRRRAKA